MLGMKTNMNNWMMALVAFLLAGNLSPFGMRTLDRLNVEPLWSDIVLSIAIFVISSVIYCMIRQYAKLMRRRSEAQSIK